MMSVPPPGEAPTMMRTGFVGQGPAAVCTGWANAAALALRASKAIRVRR